MFQNICIQNICSLFCFKSKEKVFCFLGFDSIFRKENKGFILTLKILLYFTLTIWLKDLVIESSMKI